MKLRCTENTIRIRIRKSELAQLRETGKLLESVQFPDGVKFTYNLGIDREADNYDARFCEGNIWVTLPGAAATEWIDSDAVSLAATLPLATPDEQLELLIEKDFPCTDRPDEATDDFFDELATKNEEKC